MTTSDFPPGTKFFIKGFDVPVAMPPGGKAASWFGGKKGPDWSDESYAFAKFKSNEGLSPVSFAEFANVVAESVSGSASTPPVEKPPAATGNDLKVSDFPPGTAFYIKGFDVPVAIPPGGKAASWFGGNKGPDWTAAWLVESLRDGMESVSFEEFAKVVSESTVGDNTAPPPTPNID